MGRQRCVEMVGLCLVFILVASASSHLFHVPHPGPVSLLSHGMSSSRSVPFVPFVAFPRFTISTLFHVFTLNHVFTLFTFFTLNHVFHAYSRFPRLSTFSRFSTFVTISHALSFLTLSPVLIPPKTDPECAPARAQNGPKLGP